ncbi:hypothetical protein PAAG_05208 [Paracoccidioides lutzii Pb01]|uniref:Uncharacterized protein n=1 Tax=Paracoccidioides lutzii (strain ATCC MYA-826 / Pb01) TaxID=502779 RepID=C1H365_PARBA|nr:hypothetical protein PAAG_05208 [Paracoccidioides lutzii Pb01]EEH34159.2 hypothetical protein PAAG_05208 [Paracoccidioides lutzii Pb01]
MNEDRSQAPGQMERETRAGPRGNGPGRFVGFFCYERSKRGNKMGKFFASEARMYKIRLKEGKFISQNLWYHSGRGKKMDENEE